jgi:hypothetical protein
MLPDQSQGNPQQVDPRLLMQMMMARRAQGGAIPGAAAPQQATPQAQNPTQQAVPQAGVPGAAQPQAPPQQQPQNQGGAARQLSPASPAPFNGTFGDRKGVISQLVNSAEKGAHDKKAHEAEMYYNQINSFLASGQPDDQKKAQALLDDPKIRKVLKAGLDYVPLEEAPPPEALGIHQAVQKIQQKQNMVKKLQTMLTGGQKQGSAQQSPPGRAVIPGPSQAAQQAYGLGQAKIGEAQTAAQKNIQEGNRADAQAAAETSKAETERQKLGPERVKAYAQADEMRGHAKWYGQQIKESEDLTPTKKAGLQAGQILSKARADFYGHIGKYYDRMPEGKLSGSLLRDDIKSTGTAMNEMLKGFIKDNQAAAAAMSKDTGYLFGPKDELVKKQQETRDLADKMRKGMAYFYGDGKQKVLEGTMTVPEAAAEAYRIAGVSPPDAPSEDDAPERPQGVPDNAEWDPETRTWSVGE